MRPELVDRGVYEAVHARARRAAARRRLALERRQALAHASTSSTARLAVAGAERPVADPARARHARSSSCPKARRSTLEPVTDEPWWAFNYYLGDLRSRVVMNVDVPTTGLDLIHLAAHEVYPGHHTEHAVRSSCSPATRARSRSRSSSCRRRRPCSAKGSPRRAPDLVLDETRAAALATSCASTAIEVDPRARRARSRRRSSRSATVGLDAALMIHEHGASHDEAQALHRALEPRRRPSRRSTASASPPTRPGAPTSSPTRPGRDLCRAYVGGDPARFRSC